MQLPRDYYHVFLGNGHDAVLIGYTGAMVPDRPPNGWHPYLDRCQWYKSDRYYPEDRLVDVVPPRHPPFGEALPRDGKPWAELAPLGYTAYRVEVDGQAGEVQGFTQTFAPEEGTVYTTVDWGVAQAEVTTFLCPDRPLLVIRYRFNRPVRLRVQAAPGVWQEEGHETDPFDALTFLEERPAAFYQLGPYRGFMEVALAEAQRWGREGKLWWLEGEGTIFTHYFTIADDYADPLDTEIIPRAMAEGPEALHARTRSFWRAYFAVSRFELPDPVFDRVYRTSRYLFRATQNPVSGGLPVGNLRLTWSSHLFWDAYFIHRALLEANHIAEGEAAISFFLRTQEIAERHAREEFNAPGLKWDWELTHRGEPAYGIWTHQKEQVHNNAAYANMLFQQYAFTRDRHILERVFPLLEGLATFFLHRVVEETPRGFEIRPVVGVDERPVRVRNEGLTLAGTIRLLERYVQAARLLGREGSLARRSAHVAAGLRRTLDRLYNGRYFQASEEEDRLNVSSLAPIYPMEVIPPEDPRAVRTVRAYRERYAGRMVGHGNSEGGFPWAAAVLATIQAWQGDGEGAWQTLQEIRPAFSMHGGIAETVDDEGRWNMQYFGTAHGALCTALHHLVVQAWEDGIRIGTSLPTAWERGAWENWRAHGLLLSGEWDRRRNHLEVWLHNPTAEPIRTRLRIDRMEGEFTAAPGEARWSVIAVMPFFLTVIFSLKPLTHLYEPPFFLPIPFTLENYLKVVTEFRQLFPRWMLNSTLVAGLLAVVRTLFCAMGGYAFARLRFPGRDLLFWAMLVTMMIPGQVTLIPNFLIIRQMRLLDSLAALIVPGIAGAFGVFMMTMFYKSLPRELEEAAMIDGAGWFTIFFRIVLPISRPALLTLALLTFQGEWNAFMWPLIVLNSPEKFTLPLGLSWFKGEYYTVYSVVLAGSMFNSVPILLLFFLFQGYFTRGIALTGLREG